MTICDWRQELVIHHPHGPLATKEMNLKILTTACHRGDHSKCKSHAPGGNHDCQCGCHS